MLTTSPVCPACTRTSPAAPGSAYALNRSPVATFTISTADAATGPECLDADTLAAWADNALGAAELAAAEAHAADCARCQAMLAAMARSVMRMEFDG